MKTLERQSTNTPLTTLTDAITPVHQRPCDHTSCCKNASPPTSPSPHSLLLERQSTNTNPPSAHSLTLEQQSTNTPPLTTLPDVRTPVHQHPLPGTLLAISSQHGTEARRQLCLTGTQVVHAVAVVHLRVHVQVTVWIFRRRPLYWQAYIVIYYILQAKSEILLTWNSRDEILWKLTSENVRLYLGAIFFSRIFVLNVSVTGMSLFYQRHVLTLLLRVAELKRL